MPDTLTRGDSIRQWFTGAASDGASQPLASACLGGFRSSTESPTWSVATTGISGVTILAISGVEAAGTGGSLIADNTTTLRWRPPGETSYGPASSFSGTDVEGTIEGPAGSGQYLRVSVTTPLTPGAVAVALTVAVDTFMTFPPVTEGETVAGISHYRASMAKNDASLGVTEYKVWIGTLGTSQLTNGTQLGASGSGTISASGGFADWPLSGWAQIRKADGSHRETVYYDSRTSDTLNVTVREALGTTASAGVASDRAYAVPGIAIASDPDGVQSSGTGIQVIADAHTEPAGVTWNHGIDSATGLNIGTIAAAKEVGIWVWREIPAGAKLQAAAYNRVIESFLAY